MFHHYSEFMSHGFVIILIGSHSSSSFSSTSTPPSPEPYEKESKLTLLFRLSLCILFSTRFFGSLYCFLTLIWVSWENAALKLASVHTDQPPAWLSPDLSGLDQDDPSSALHNMSIECLVRSLINPSCLLFNFTRKTVNLVFVHLFLVMRMIHLFELLAVNSFRIDCVWLLFSLCIIVILEMYSKYFDPITNNIIASQ